MPQLPLVLLALGCLTSCSSPLAGSAAAPVHAEIEPRLPTLQDLPTLDPAARATPDVEDAEAAVAKPAAAPRGPITKPVDELRVDKSEHRLDLVSKGEVVRTYKIAIGPGGLGPKRWEWDMVTPVGTYTISGPYKLFHQFLAISYPNRDDKIRYAELSRQGVVPPGRGVGNGIGLHGGGSHSDWTAGCIAVENEEIDEIVSVVKPGTKIVITD